MSASPKSSINTPSISRFTHFKTGHSPSSSAISFCVSPVERLVWLTKA
jgi:hypothetical protein